jgi:hypothetical protein
MPAVRHEPDRTHRAGATRNLVVPAMPTIKKIMKVGNTNLYN